MARIGQRNRRTMRLLAYMLAGFGSLLPITSVAEASVAEVASNAPTSAEVQAQIEHLRDKSDRELTALTAQWGQLSSVERRILLAEVRNRMQLRKATQANQPKVRVTRRYGRIVRKADGSVVVQTQVVTPTNQVEPRTTVDGQQVVARGQMRRQGRITFGFGFERRGARNSQGTTPALDSAETPDVSHNITPDGESVAHPATKN